MLNEKYITPISIVTLLISVLLVIAIIISDPADNSDSKTTAVQAKYLEKVLNKNHVTEINIEIDRSDWECLLENATNEEYRSCNITVNGTTFNNVGIRPKGNSTLRSIAGSESDRFSFKLDFGEYIKGQTCYGLRKIALNNIMSDKTYMKEYLSYEMFDYMGINTPAYAYTNVKVNDENWGFYLAIEVIGESFVARYYGSTDGNLYKPESMEMGGGELPNRIEQQAGQPPIFARREKLQENPNNMPLPENEAMFPNISRPRDKRANLEGQPGERQPPNGRPLSGSTGANLKYNGDSASNYTAIKENAVFKTTTDKDFEKVITMIKNLNEGNLEDVLDVDEVLRFWAVNTFLVNLDSYAGGMYHNYYLYEKDGVFQILPWDFNLSFAGFGLTDGTKAINFPIDNPVTGNLEDAPLIGKLLEVPEYKELYYQYLREIVENYIGRGRYENTIAKIDKLIDKYVKNDPTAFYSYEDYKKAVPVLLEFGRERAASITAQLAGIQPSTSYGNLSSTINLSDLGGMGGGGRGKGIADIRNNEANIDMPQQPTWENMQEIMEIMNTSKDSEFTEEQKKRLKQLGADENMLDMLKNRSQHREAVPNQKMTNTAESTGNRFMTKEMRSASLLLSVFAIITALLFVHRFRRKK